MAAEHRHFIHLDSTNRYLKEWASKSDPAHGALVTADYQSHGRGQYGRQWASAAGQNLLMSILLRPKTLSPSESYWITLSTALAIIKFLSAITETPLQIKWPNDIYADGRKLAGVLTESSVQGDQVQYVVVGIGLNVRKQEWPAEINPLPMTLDELHITDIRLQQLAHYLRQEILSALLIPREEIVRDFNTQLYGRNALWSFTIDDQSHSAILSHLDQEGHLHFQSDSGQKWYTPAWEVKGMKRVV